MTGSSIAELRLAAKQARDFARVISEPIVRQVFLDLSAKWDAEADGLLAMKETEAFGSGRISFDPS